MAPMAHRWRMVAVVAVLAAGLSGCGAFGGIRGDKEGLTESVNAFLQFVRYGDYEKASPFVVHEGVEGFWAAADALQGRVRVTEAHVRSIGGTDTDTTREVLVVVRYFRMNEATMKSATLRQRWVYDANAKAWQVSETDLGRITGQ